MLRNDNRFYKIRFERRCKMEELYITSEITLNKTTDERVSPIPTNTEFFTYDQHVAKKVINFQLEGEPLDLSETNVILGFYFVNADCSFLLESADGSVAIEDAKQGKVSVMLPNDMYAYSGQVLVYVYVEFHNGQSLDYPVFSTQFQESWIDQKLDEMASFYVKRFEDLREAVKEVVDKSNEQLFQLQQKVEKIEDKVNETNQKIGELGKLKKMYSNSIDFGNYEYSGNANLLPKITAAHFTSGNGATVEDGPDGEIIFTLDGSAQLTKFNTSMRLPALQNGKRYTISAEIMLHEGLEGDASNIRLTTNYLPGGQVMLATARPSPTATNSWHTIKGTQIVTYATTLPQQWYVVLQDVTASSRIKGKISLRNIKVEEGSIATPYQPNLLVEPYQMSKISLNENLANKEQTFPISSRQYLVYSAEMIEPFIADQTYTLTLKGTKLGPQSFRVYTTGPNSTSNIGDMEIVEGVADTWRLAFTPSEVNLNGSVSPSTLQIYQFPQATMGQATIESLKIEKGDIATPNISEYKYFGEGLKDSSNPNDYSWDVTPEYINERISD